MCGSLLRLRWTGLSQLQRVRTQSKSEFRIYFRSRFCTRGLPPRLLFLREDRRTKRQRRSNRMPLAAVL